MDQLLIILNQLLHKDFLYVGLVVILHGLRTTCQKFKRMFYLLKPLRSSLQFLCSLMTLTKISILNSAVYPLQNKQIMLFSHSSFRKILKPSQNIILYLSTSIHNSNFCCLILTTSTHPCVNIEFFIHYCGSLSSYKSISCPKYKPM